MTIQWLGRACFRLVSDGYSLVIDPYSAGSTGYPPLRVSADMVLVSHDHLGHNNVAAVSLSGTARPCPFEIQRVEVSHDNSYGYLRGMNTAHILCAEGLKIVHLGDVGLKCDDGRLFDPDVLMCGCGSFRTLPPYVMKELADELRANVIIPMHYHHGSHGNRRLSRLEDFTDLYQGEREVVEYPTDTLEASPGMPPQVAVLKYMGKD